jgi:DNA-binding NarL/FixJ family response regulator
VSIRILIADDQAVVRSGFRAILEDEPDLEVIGEAEDGLAAVELARRRNADVVLMDVRMPRMGGLEATRRLTGPGVEDPVDVLVVTTFDLDDYVFGALRAGAAGFLLKDASPETLVSAIRAVANGQGLIAPEVTRRLIAHFAARCSSRSLREGQTETSHSSSSSKKRPSRATFRRSCSSSASTAASKPSSSRTRPVSSHPRTERTVASRSVIRERRAGPLLALRPTRFVSAVRRCLSRSTRAQSRLRRPRSRWQDSASKRTRGTGTPGTLLRAQGPSECRDWERAPLSLRRWFGRRRTWTER